MFASRRVVQSARRGLSTSSAQASFIKVSEDLSKSTGQDVAKIAHKLVGAKDAFLKEMEDPIMRGVGFLTLGFFAVVHHKRRNDKKHAAAHHAHDHDDHHDDAHHVAPAAHAVEHAVQAVAAPVEEAAAAAVSAVAAPAAAPAAAAPVAAAAQDKVQVKPILHQLGDVADRLSAIEKALGIAK